MEGPWDVKPKLLLLTGTRNNYTRFVFSFKFNWVLNGDNFSRKNCGSWKSLRKLFEKR